MQRFHKIGIITYQAPHLKTEQVLNQLLSNPLLESAGGGVIVYALSFKPEEEQVVVCT